MSYHRRHRVDGNQDDIIEAIEKIGAKVTSMSQVGNGVADLLVSFRQRWFVMEVKMPKGKLKDAQRTWIGAQRAPVVTVKSPLEAVTFLQQVRP